MPRGILHYTPLTEAEWALLAKAEAPLYEGDPGAHEYTSVHRRVEAGLAALLWQHASEHAVDLVEWKHENIDPESPEMEQLIEAEVAKRVAHALAAAAFGLEYFGEALQLRSEEELPPC